MTLPPSTISTYAATWQEGMQDRADQAGTNDCEGALMSHYKSNIRDIEFNLFEVFGRDEVLGHGPSRTSTARPPARS